MNDILAGLSSVADKVIAMLIQKIGEVNAPSAIKDNIGKGSPVSNGNNAFIDIIINHPAAAAFEWGSGIHATRGKAGKYEIRPKNAPMLMFPKERWPQYEPPPPAPDVFAFSLVNHPGVRQRPFISPTVKESLEETKKILGASMKAQLLRGEKVYEEITIK